MRIPPLYRKPNWQRFFAGAAIGGCISWLVFLFMFGIMQEKTSSMLDQQANQIKELKRNLSIWQEDFQELNKENEDMLTIQNIEVKVLNFERYNISDRQSIFNIEEGIKEDLKSLLAKDLTTVYKNRDIIKKTVENKTMNINGKRYQLIVHELYFYTTISLVLEIKLAG